MSLLQRLSAPSILVVAAAFGGAAGYMSLPNSGTGEPRTQAELLAEQAIMLASEAAVAAELIRAREPQPGDIWGGCNDARDAGTAPIYAGEPGYRADMDGDGDGVACEPIP